MEDCIPSSADHRGLKLQNIIQKLSEHCEIKHPQDLEIATDEEEFDTLHDMPRKKRKEQNGSDKSGLGVNGSSMRHTNTSEITDELNSDLKLECKRTESHPQYDGFSKISTALPRERISARIRNLKSKKVSYEEQDWVDPDQIRLSGKKIPVQSSKNSLQDDSAQSITQKRKRRRRKTVQSVEDYVNEAPLIQVGNLVGLRQCRLCAVMFVEKEQLISHMKAVHHLDDKVNIKIQTTESSQNEEQVRDDDDKPHKCSQCESSFRKSSGLKQHVTRQHSQNLTQKTSQSKSDHGTSRRSASNSNDRPYVCQICGKAFKRKHHLQEHSYIHSVDKPFKCDTCSKTFNQRICLTKHLPCRELEKQQRKPSSTSTGNNPVAEQHQTEVVEKSIDVKKLNVKYAEIASECDEANSANSRSGDNMPADISNKLGVRSRINGSKWNDKTCLRRVSNGDLSPQHGVSKEDPQESRIDVNKVAFSGFSPTATAKIAVSMCEQTLLGEKLMEKPQDETQRILKQQN